MRFALVLVVICGCFVIPDRPAVQPRLSELPGEREKQDAILDRAYTEPAPEAHKPLPSVLRKLETVVATAAVLVGVALSRNANVTVGYASSFEEAPAKPQPRHEPRGDLTPAPATLVPWVRLGSGADAATATE